MAYLRSGVTLLIAGVSIIHFSPEGWFWMMGLACIPAGIITAVIGIMRYRQMNNKILSVRNQSTTLGEQEENASHISSSDEKEPHT
jgi:putative membrane protein